MKNDSKHVLARFVKLATRLYHDSAPIAKDRSWTKTAKEMGVSRGTLLRIVRDGYEPRINSIRAIIGLTQHVEVMTCPKCGKIHTQRKSCGSRTMKRLRRESFKTIYQRANASIYKES